MSLPQDFQYTNDHEWVAVSGDVARIGITDYAQDALGDIVFIQLPTIGDQVSAHDSFSEIESTKSVNDVYAPVGGVVHAINSALVDNPELLNSDPYGAGWICEIKMSTDTPVGLLSAAEYGALIA